MEQRHQPIGVFDSGLGGISVLAEAMSLLPAEDFIYYGDNGNAPYGDKHPDQVLELSRAVVDDLLKRNCKAVLIACNTATSAAAASLRAELTVPVIGMEPALKPAALMPGQGAVLVLATRMTLRLPKFSGLMELYGQDAQPIPCPGLVELVEQGELEGEQVEEMLRGFLAPYLDRPVKAIVLGCTHYVSCASHPAGDWRWGGTGGRQPGHGHAAVAKAPGGRAGEVGHVHSGKVCLPLLRP